MAKNFHSRSNSLPSKLSHPMMENVENHLGRIKSSEATSTSSLLSNLSSLRDLHEEINNLIQTPSVQQAQGENWINELLEGSLRLVDLCGFARDVIYSIKESVQELESSIRRNRGEKATADEINAYVSSRKKIVKKVKNCIKNLKSFDQNSTALQQEDGDLKAVASMMKESQALDFSILRSVLLLVSGEKEGSKSRNRSIFSKFSTHSSRVYSQESDSEELCFLDIHKSRKNMDNISILKQLKASEMTIQEIEEGLESLFKSLVKTRVSLLNLLSH